MLTIVYTPAHNELRLSVTAFSTYEKAVEFLKGVFGTESHFLEKEENGKRTFTIGNNGKKRYQSFPNGEVYEYFSYDKISKEQSKKLFTYYYGGCGECYEVVAQEINDGECPLFPFDQD